MIDIDTSEMVSLEALDLGDEVENSTVKQLAKEVEVYLGRFSWFQRVNRLLYAAGFSKVAVFFVEIESRNYDRRLWLVAGDLPFAHLVVDDLPNAKEVLITYVEIMRDWIDAVQNDGDLKECFPVRVAPTLENAAELAQRLDFIEHRYIPEEFP